MKTLTEIKAEKQSKFSALLDECLVFFAFSDEQFQEGKTPLKEGEKYVAMGSGGYMPKGKVKQYLEGSEAIDKWYKEAIKERKLRKENIAYELSNHEAYYTNDISDTLEALGSDYTAGEVKEVFNFERKRQHILNY